MKASIFATCIVDNFYPQVGEAMVRILEKVGVDLDFLPKQVCCGQPAFNIEGKIFRDRARKTLNNEFMRKAEGNA